MEINLQERDSTLKINEEELKKPLINLNPMYEELKKPFINPEIEEIPIPEMIEIRKFMLEKSEPEQTKNIMEKIGQKEWKKDFQKKIFDYFEFSDVNRNFYNYIIKIHIFYMMKYFDNKIFERWDEIDKQDLKDIWDSLAHKNMILIILRTYKFIVDLDIKVKQFDSKEGNGDIYLSFSANEKTYKKNCRKFKIQFTIKALCRAVRNL